MQYLSTACMSLVILLLGCATPPKTGVSIDSFRVVKTGLKTVEIGFVGSNDGSKGEVCLGAIAKSKDGSVRSEGAYSPVMPVGQNIKFARYVMRPHEPGKHQTDFLMALVNPCGKEQLLTQKFDWPYVWPEISTGEKLEKNEGLGTTNPWSAILGNFQDEDFSAAISS
jgi:hypothetical protein